MMKQLCQSCETADATISDTCDDPDDPYQLCLPCSARLQARILRPAEWYSLARRHGWRQHLLHDDFYDELALLAEDLQDEVLAHASLLAQFGPNLGRPAADTLKGSRHANMKELRFE
jgi:hypothetical protein